MSNVSRNRTRLRLPKTRIFEARTETRARPDAGFVLVSVLWLLALLTLIVFAVVTTVRLDVRATRQILRHAEAEALADGLTRLTALTLAERYRRPLSSTSISTDGTPYLCKHGQATTLISVTDAGGLVDLNASSGDLLEWLFRGLNLSADRAQRLAAAIQDFRDEDNMPVVDGAEYADYRAAHLPHGPKNAPFETITELDQVLGMDLDLLDRLKSVVTVHSRQPGIDPRVAPQAVLAAAANTSSYFEQPPNNTGAGPRGAIPAWFRISSKAPAFRITVHVRFPNGGQFAREAVIEPERTSALGFFMREWTTSLPISDLQQNASEPVNACLSALN